MLQKVFSVSLGKYKKILPNNTFSAENATFPVFVTRNTQVETFIIIGIVILSL